MTGRNANFIRQSCQIIISEDEKKAIDDYIQNSMNVSYRLRELILQEIEAPTIQKPETVKKFFRWRLKKEENIQLQNFLKKNGFTMSFLVKTLILEDIKRSQETLDSH